MEAKDKKTTEGIINQDVVNMLVKLQELRQTYYSQIGNLRRINLECDYIPLKHDFDSAYVDMYAAIEAMLGETTRLNIQGV